MWLRRLMIMVLLGCSAGGFAQEEGVFTSLSEALKATPEDVVVLKLKRKKLTEFPMEILQFVNLRELYLNGNRITELPKEIGKLSNLEVLNVAKNKLKGLPSEIGDLKNLQKLYLNNNNIEVLPKTIGNLTRLEYLDLWNTGVDVLPDEIANLKNVLKIVDLRVIYMGYSRQEAMKELLPNTRFYFSRPCKCD